MGQVIDEKYSSQINTFSMNMGQVVIYGPPQATVLRLSPPQSLLRVFAQQRERAHARVEDVLDKTKENFKEIERRL